MSRNYMCLKLLFPFIFLILSMAEAKELNQIKKETLSFLTKGKVLGDEYYTVPVQENLQAIYSRELNSQLKHTRVKLKLKKKERMNYLHNYMKKGNEKALKKFLKSTSNSKKISKEAMLKAFEKLKTNSITNIANNSQYDKSGEIGFCFGRSFYAHLLLKKAGASQLDMAKIFVLGRLRQFGQLWDYHMATIVRIKNNEWWVVDTLFTEPIKLEKWVKLASAFGVKKEKSQVKIFITDPRKYQSQYGIYEKSFFEIPDLKKYFDKLFLAL